MRTAQALLAGAGLLLAIPAPAQTPAAPAPATPAASAPAPRRYPAATLGLALGWGAPYGWGIDYSHLVSRKQDVTAGAGITLTGGKLGIGTRYYFTPQRRVSAFVGANLVYSSGWDNLRITSHSTSTNGGSSYYANPASDAVVNYTAATLLHLRGGLRWQPLRRFAMLSALGYGVVLSGGNVEYVSGDYDQPARDTAHLLAPGGIEASCGIAFGIY